jgi:integrase
MDYMTEDSRSYSSEEKYRLIGGLIEEIKLRRYSFQTGKSYISTVNEFLSSGKTPREFLLSYTTKSKSTMRSAYFALKFFHENVLNAKFEEKLPLAKKSLKLPLVLSKEEVIRMFDSTNNLKHKLIIMFLYYAGLRLDEVRNITWLDIDIDRETIHLKMENITKGQYNRL